MIFAELAKAFDVRPDQLAEMMGIARQTLYVIGNGRHLTYTNRMTAALNAMRYFSIEMYKKDVEEAKARKIARDEELNRLEDLIRKGVI